MYDENFIAFYRSRSVGALLFLHVNANQNKNIKVFQQYISSPIERCMASPVIFDNCRAPLRSLRIVYDAYFVKALSFANQIPFYWPMMSLT